jgi:hypothetical protein
MAVQFAQWNLVCKLGIAIAVGAIAEMMSGAVAQAVPLDSFRPQPAKANSELTSPLVTANGYEPASQTDVQLYLPLARRYGCSTEIRKPNSAYEPTRYRFAAALNGCANKLNELVEAGTVVSSENWSTLKQLERAYAGEIAALRFQIDALEARTKEQEQQQFSPTTNLHGETVLELSGIRR